MRISTSGKQRRWVLATVLCGVLITGCSSGGGGDGDAKAKPAAEPEPLDAGALHRLLLSQADLGAGYVQAQETPDSEKFDDVSVQGCPQLEKLGQNASETMFASKAETSFTYDTDASLGEELHSDRPSVLSSGLRQLFGAYTSCPAYSVTAGTTPIEVKVAKSAAPELGDEQFAYTSTMELPSGAQVLKTMAVRKGNIAVMLVGAPALVDRHIKTAVGKLSSGS
ncbi:MULTISPECIES: hypothetical protein [unclassified Streptomyces]|uniref:hypothetical protein n=1 Tax=unclassified Streptomyces TaxID=2593676 RepID=UPI0006C2C6EB|nr:MULTISPECIES: hypothetical protein [unclassified Streptomyces]KOV73397.1 hypothetical protein ADL02_40230 [Streptomyces sp. NRRL WC-3723]